jgi:hypothetical protein
MSLVAPFYYRDHTTVYFHSQYDLLFNITLPKNVILPELLTGCVELSGCAVLRRGSAAARLLELLVGIPPGAWMSVCCECCVLSVRGLCDELIIRPEESY